MGMKIGTFVGFRCLKAHLTNRVVQREPEMDLGRTPRTLGGSCLRTA